MKIKSDYDRKEGIGVIAIISAIYVGEYIICVSFNDGIERLVDFKPFLVKALHPSISKYLKLDIFKQFEIVNGNLNWNGYDLIFPIHQLYEGEIK